MQSCIRKSFCACLLLIMFCVSAQAVLASQKININKATLAELVVLKGVGEKTAANIIKHREAEGGFKSIAEIVNVKGIGEKTFAKLADQITIGDEEPQQ